MFGAAPHSFVPIAFPDPYFLSIITSPKFLRLEVLCTHHPHTSDACPALPYDTSCRPSMRILRVPTKTALTAFPVVSLIILASSSSNLPLSSASYSAGYFFHILFHTLARSPSPDNCSDLFSLIVYTPPPYRSAGPAPKPALLMLLQEPQIEDPALSTLPLAGSIVTDLL